MVDQRLVCIVFGMVNYVYASAHTHTQHIPTNLLCFSPADGDACCRIREERARGDDISLYYQTSVLWRHRLSHTSSPGCRVYVSV